MHKKKPRAPEERAAPRADGQSRRGRRHSKKRRIPDLIRRLAQYGLGLRESRRCARELVLFGAEMGNYVAEFSASGAIVTGTKGEVLGAAVEADGG